MNDQNPTVPVDHNAQVVPVDPNAGVGMPPVANPPMPVEESKVEEPVVAPGAYVPPVVGTPEPVITPPVEEKPADQQLV